MKPVDILNELGNTHHGMVDTFYLENRYVIFRKEDYEKAQVVWGYNKTDSHEIDIWGRTRFHHCVKKALIVCIEEIEPIKECEHKEVHATNTSIGVKLNCNSCKKWVTPNGWKVEEGAERL